ncbi:MAG: MFS transporter [Alphaproteobacteria bacterium]|nr:MFS transporter [Alphaproteobacteria bacterium]MBU6472944.1 MFS transporter [Alphaproteobacteria bacterium]MDE2011608.1 MFS transporter [Alphaproteobacteria bacterium]MDE2071954.1 MFS transporter [Alphaproteobacteria bacterium]
MNNALDRPARFRWLPPGLRPPVPMQFRQEQVFLLVGIAALFAGYDVSVYGLAVPKIQAALHIPEDQVGLTITYFRLATLVAMPMVAMADVVGRRRVLLVTIFGQAIATLATAFAQNYSQFVWLQIATRFFGYCEEMLIWVVIAEEVSAAARGWANGTLSAMYYVGTGIASLVYAGVTILPGGWRAIYVVGSIPLFFVAFLRRRLPETARFEVRESELHRLTSRASGGLDLLRHLLRDYPRRLFLILAVAGIFGFATAPAFFLSAMYLQTGLGYASWQTTLLLIPGGFAGLGLSILTGRLSDRIGRRHTIAMTGLIGLLAFGSFYGGAQGAVAAVAWVLGSYAYFSTDALISGFATEIVPTAYRATVSGLRYGAEIGAGAVSLALEGLLYDRFGAHGPAMLVLLAALPLALILLPLLPEPAGRALEEISDAANESAPA